MADMDFRLQNFHNSYKYRFHKKFKYGYLLVVIYNLIFLSILITKYRSFHRPISGHLVLAMVLIDPGDSSILVALLVAKSDDSS